MANNEEYKNKIEEIQDLVDSGDMKEALEELDEMNFKKVHNINTLLEASSIYEKAEKYDDAFDVLFLAYERSPASRLVIYRLAMLSIKMGELDEAKGYYDRFVYVAPHDNLKYEIKYSLAKAKDADPNTLIEILEELKNREFIEKWAYELAKLYHETGQVNKCTDICDEIILWFGDGPYVERALELKMLYKPLTPEQEEKYRLFQKKGETLTEIHPEDAKDDSQILSHTVRIPKIELPPEKYDTVNLQAEIKRNIEEIMQATEQSDVKENLDAIKDLTKEFPFLNVDTETEEDKKSKEEKKELEDKKIDEGLKDNFQKYLVEEYDGQMTMLLPNDTSYEDDTIKGQITIQDIMNEWNKTKRAAEKALSDAENEKLEIAKSDAIEEANRIADRLSDAAPKLEAGVSPRDVLKEEYLSKPSKETFTEGISTERLDSDGQKIVGEISKDPLQIDEKDLKPWNPPVIERPQENEEIDSDAVNTKEASKIIEDMNLMLQKQIDEISREDAVRKPREAERKSEETLDEMLSIVSVTEHTDENAEIVGAITKSYDEENSLETPTDSLDASSNSLADSSDSVDAPVGTKEEDSVIEPEDIVSAVDAVQPDTSDEAGILADTVTSIMNEEKKDREEEETVRDAQLNGMTGKEAEEQAEVFDASPTRDLAKGNEQFFKAIAGTGDGLEDRIIYQTTRDIKNEEKESPDYVSEDGLKDEVSSVYSDLALTDEEKEAFTYFTPISGMEQALAQVLYGARERLSKSNSSSSGNIIIEGGHGSGKTTLALAIVKVLREEIGKPNNRVGKIDGEKLNEKNIQQLFSKIEGGCLIVEGAGALKRETVVTMSLLMDNDKSGIFIILEDDRKGIEKALSLDGYFSRKFTEKIVIPVLTIDELVNFGEAYADDMGYTIDEMGVLALYDRINRILRLDHLTEVKEIIDEAIDDAEHGGFFSRVAGKKFDDNGKRILQEKNFQI